MDAVQEQSPRPWWLILVFGAEGGGWLFQAAFSVFFIIYASNYPEAGRLLFLGFQLLVALLAAGIFFVGIARTIRRSPLQRFAVVHTVVGALVTVPFVVLSLWQTLDRVDEVGWGEVIKTVLIGLALLAIPIGGVAAGRSEKIPLQVLAVVIGILWVLCGALFSLGLGVGVAGVNT